MDTTSVEFGSTPASAESKPEDASPSTEDSSAASSGPQEPTVASVDDVAEEFGGLMGALSKSKKKKVAKEEAKAAEAKAAEENAVQIKSKKEKEREKKEREKLKKKQQAEAKKANQKAANTALEEEREKAKKIAQTLKEEELKKPAEADDSKPAAAAPKKKKNAASAALQKRLIAQREAADAQRKAEEDEKKRIAEEEARLAEEERLKEEARQRKKERERLKKEELRKQGKLLTKKQKEQLRIAELRRKQLLESGNITVAAFADKDSTSTTNNNKPQQTHRPGSSQASSPATKSSSSAPSSQSSSKSSPADVPASERPMDKPIAAVVVEIKKEEKKEEKPVEDEPLLDSWENALDSDAEEKVADDEDDKEEEESEDETSQTEESKESDSSASTGEQSSKGKDLTDLEKALSHAHKNKQIIEQKYEERIKDAQAHANAKDLRSPICCILGHVDTGKTKLLDKVRQTNVQEGEAGGITQQIGATYFPIEAIEKKTEVMKKYVNVDFSVPGLLIIDTPGHESFSNLRSRGSSLCNIAILVIDIMHGLEQQTIESIKLLRDRKTPFIVALNKIDRLYGWEVVPNNSFRDSLSRQSSSVQREFQDRFEKAKLALAEQGLNSELYYQNKNVARNVSIVPTSAVTGEGVPDLLYLLLELTQTRMSKQLMYLSTLEATILEVKVVEGLGTTIDVVLSNGILREGDRIVLCGQNGPIITNVRALLTPQPLRELRIKSAYVHHKEVKAALGVKIAANDLDKAVAGSRLLLVGPDDDEDELMDEVMDDLTGLLDSVDKSGQGVCVQASTLGSLEALLDFLKDMKIPVMSIGIGPVFKRDVMRATTMLEKRPELALMLCFDVKIDKEAEQYAHDNAIRIFNADIIYHLFDSFTAYQKQLLEKKREQNANLAVYPCVLKTIQIINKRNPMIIGADILNGSIRVGTPISVVKPDPATGAKQILDLGRVASMEVNHKTVDIVKKGQANAGVAVRLSDPTSSSQPIWGRHIDEKDTLYSHISRASIDVLKDPAFRDDVPREDWLLIKNLKPIFDIK